MTHPPELRERAKALRQQGLLCREIGVELGVPKATVIRWLNPKIEKRGRVRSRKAKYSLKKKCARCKRRVSDTSTICMACYRANQKYWTAERIVEAIQNWTIEHGYAPTYLEWQRSGPGHPAISSIKEGPDPSFRSWGDALRAAGFTPRKRRARTGGAPLTEAQKAERAALRRLAREEKLRIALEKENENDEPGSV